MFSRRPVPQHNRGRVPSGSAASAPAPPADDPLVIWGADLHQWLRGDLGVTIVTGVSSWADQSGKGNDAIQGTGAAQPTYTASDATLDNRSTVTADGSNDVLTCATLTTDLATDDFYVCGVVKAITWTNGDSLTSGAGTTPPRSFQSGASPTMTMTATSGVNANAGAVLGTWVRYEAFFSTTLGVSYLKIGSTVVQTGNPGTGLRTSSTIFGAPAALFGNFAVAEYIIVKRAAGSGGPTGAERTRNDAYLQARYPSASF